MPICQLCGRTCVKLEQSHLIPKLVYKRVKAHKHSRFRDLSNIKLLWQDGEKHEMLCKQCEEKFSKLETKFANDFLDIYRRTDKIPAIDINGGWLGNYITSVSWRILNDEIFRLNAFDDKDDRLIFESFESILGHHLKANPIENI